MFVIQRSDGTLMGNSMGAPFETMEEAQLSMAYVLKSDPNAQIITHLSNQQREMGERNQQQYQDPPDYPRKRIGIFSKDPISYVPFNVAPAGKVFSKPPFSLPGKRRRFPTESEDTIV